MKEEQARALIAAQFEADGHAHHRRVKHWPLDALPYSDRIAIRALMALPERPLREDEWRCFHCGDVFTSAACARAHFGREDGATPACQLKGADGGLLRALREAEDSAADAWAAIHSESLDVHRALAAAQSRHGQALTNAEELGYQRGLRDSSVADGFTYAVEHNPNCPRAFLVRLPRGVLDHKPEGLSTDAIGYGLTFLEAFAAAQEKLARPAPTEADVIEGLLDKARAL